MKTFPFILLVLVFGTLPSKGKSQSNSTVPQLVKLSVNEMVHDFGKIPQGKPVFYNFIAKNLAATPVVIETVQASCGCTTPEWSSEPIQEGGSSIIKVGYNAAAPGYFEKTITVVYAGGNNILLTIKGEVWKTPDQSAPLNKSIAFLKTLKTSEFKKP
jgi:hypothetical protein